MGILQTQHRCQLDTNLRQQLTSLQQLTNLQQQLTNLQQLLKHRLTPQQKLTMCQFPQMSTTLSPTMYTIRILTVELSQAKCVENCQALGQTFSTAPPNRTPVTSPGWRIG